MILMSYVLALCPDSGYLHCRLGIYSSLVTCRIFSCCWILGAFIPLFHAVVWGLVSWVYDKTKVCFEFGFCVHGHFFVWKKRSLLFTTPRYLCSSYVHCILAAIHSIVDWDIYVPNHNSIDLCAEQTCLVVWLLGSRQTDLKPFQHIQSSLHMSVNVKSIPCKPRKYRSKS